MKDNIEELKIQIEKLERKVRILESEIHSKEIIIDALITKVKIEKSQNETGDLCLKREYEGFSEIGDSKRFKLDSNKNSELSYIKENTIDNPTNEINLKPSGDNNFKATNNFTPMEETKFRSSEDNSKLLGYDNLEATNSFKSSNNFKEDNKANFSNNNSKAIFREDNKATFKEINNSMATFNEDNIARSSSEINRRSKESSNTSLNSSLASNVSTTKSREETTFLPGLEFTEADDQKSPELQLMTEKLISEIKETFKPKSKKTDFRPNFTFSKFVEYCESSYEFSLLNKKVSKTKNPLRQFILNNLERIVKFLVENINELSLNQVCSTFFLINSEIDYSFKLVIFHDIVLELENCSKLAFIASALFNNQDFSCDLFSQLIKKILFHQVSVDYDIVRDSEISEYLNLILDNLSLSVPEISLWQSLSHFMVKHQLFDPVKFTIKSEAIEKGFMVRMICQYLDWNYTYNTFIVTQLYPKVISDRAPIHVYYLGILTINAYRLFGNHESISATLEELRNILEWNDQCSVVAYLILKQIYSVECENWILKNGDSLAAKGFDLDYLRKFLLI